MRLIPETRDDWRAKGHDLGRDLTTAPIMTNQTIDPILANAGDFTLRLFNNHHLAVFFDYGLGRFRRFRLCRCICLFKLGNAKFRYVGRR